MATKHQRPWTPVEAGGFEAGCIQALSRGDASPDQQMRGLKWIIEVVCGTYDASYRPGDDGRRDTDFAEGKRYCGNTLVKMTRLDMSKLREEEKT